MAKAETRKVARVPEAQRALPDVRFSRGTRATAIGGQGLASWDEDTLSFEFVLASETPCRSYRLSPDGCGLVEVEEVLTMDGIEDVDLLVGAPILNMHWSYSLDAVIGVVEEARVDGTQLVCRGRLWDREDLKEVVDGVRKGILRNMSVGFDRSEETYQERTGQAPLVTVTAWQPAEASVVAVPADPTAQTRSAKPAATRSTAPKRTAAMATKPTKAQRAAATAAELSEAEAALAIAESNVDAARAKAGLPARKKREDEDMSERGDDDTEEQGEGDDAEGSDDGDKGDDATDDKKGKKRSAAQPDAKRAALIDGLRTVARRRGKEALEDFEAIEAAGGGLDELRAAAVAAVRTKSPPVSNTQTGARAQGEQKLELRSFSETAFGKRNQR